MKKLILLLMILCIIPAALGSVSRDLPTSVNTNTEFDVTYTSTSGFTGIEETVPSGFTLVNPDSLTSLEGGVLRTAWTGDTVTVRLRSAGTTGTVTFTGNYEGTGDAIGTIGGDSSMTIGGTSCTCTSWADAGCSGTQMSQTRTCTPSACDTETRLVADASCGTTTGDVTRSMPSTIKINTNFDVTYTSTGSATGIVENVPAGFTLITSDSLTNLTDGVLRTFWTGSTKTITLNSGSSTGTKTFTGTFEGTGIGIGDITGVTSISVTDDGTPGTKTCYACIDDTLETQTVDSTASCPTGYSITQPSCGGVDPQTCEEINNCEFYETCNDTNDGCNVAVWVYLAGGGLILLVLLKSM